jgi:hypothetical protein
MQRELAAGITLGRSNVALCSMTAPGTVVRGSSEGPEGATGNGIVVKRSEEKVEVAMRNFSVLCLFYFHFLLLSHLTLP